MTTTSRPFLIALFTLLVGIVLPISAAVSGEWTAYPAYSSVAEAVKGGSDVYVLSAGSLYSVNLNDKSVTTYDKTKTLSDSEIAHIAWCSEAQRLVIVYTNQNIDLLEKNGNTVNVSDYYSKSMMSDKTVNAINVSGKYAYLSTNFGIVKLNVAAAEISNTYTLGFAVMWTHTDNSRIYAESKSHGQYSALLSANLLDKSSWTRTADFTAENKTLSKELLDFANTYKPEGPALNHFGFMRMHNGMLYTTPNLDDNPSYPAYIQIKNGTSWTVIDDKLSYESKPRFRNINSIDFDPKDDSHIFAGTVAGLYEYKDYKVVKNYYWENSVLERATSVKKDNIDYTKTPAVKFDKEGNLWLIQGSSPVPSIIKLDRDGRFTILKHEELRHSATTSWSNPRGLDFDSRGLLWFVNRDWRTPALASYNINTDELKVYKEFINEDANEVNLVYTRCWTEDKDGNIWLGTDVGPVALLASTIKEGGTVFEQIKVPRNDGTNLADYLLAGVDVNCMAVDGGNRKWFGTSRQGVYVISSDNKQEIHHFTAANSGLLSDNIESIAVDDASGEVYIGTDKGLCSYKSDATASQESLEKDNIYAYPNPVRPDYTGPITVVGLTYNAQVKITTSSGQLVAEGRSNGGTFRWDGKDRQGRRVASGVYMVMASTEDGKTGVVTKIAIIN